MVGPALPQGPHQRLSGAGFPDRYGMQPDHGPLEPQRVATEALRQMSQVSSLAPRAPGQPGQRERDQQVQQDRVGGTPRAHRCTWCQAPSTAATEGAFRRPPTFTARRAPYSPVAAGSVAQ